MHAAFSMCVWGEARMTQPVESAESVVECALAWRHVLANIIWKKKERMEKGDWFTVFSLCDPELVSNSVVLPPDREKPESTKSMAMLTAL